jgi:membrane associated rhomboid family serine protease
METLLQTQSRNADLRRGIRLLAVIVALFWLVELVDFVAPGRPLDWYGVHPRTLLGLRNILLAPLLHVGFGHLLANSVPFFVLGLLVILHGGLRGFYTVSLAAVVTSGLGVWLLGGGNTVHLGASGVIFGYFGFLLAAAWWERSPRSLLVALVVLVFYGGMIWGVLPGQQGISWLAHLFGLLGGLYAAWLLHRRTA